jgi:hypothetical protein
LDRPNIRHWAAPTWAALALASISLVWIAGVWLGDATHGPLGLWTATCPHQPLSDRSTFYRVSFSLLGLTGVLAGVSAAFLSLRREGFGCLFMVLTFFAGVGAFFGLLEISGGIRSSCGG